SGVMKTRDEILSILAEVLPSIRARYPIGEIVLFGSYSRGEQTESSDVDLAVEYVGSMTFREQVMLESELSAALNVRVDLADRDGLRRRIRDRMERDAIAV